jgi:hypothetical protein
MLAIFCMRLASGLIGMLVLLSPAQINPRFYRVQFLTALGLAAVAAVSVADWAGTSHLWVWVALGSSLLLAFAGSLAWFLHGAPGGRTLIGLGALSFAAALGLTSLAFHSNAPPGWVLADELTSAALLGTALTAMLMGHSYLIAPSMSIQPLRRLLGALLVALLLRCLVAGAGLWSWTAEHSLAKLTDVTMLLPLRWGIGLVAPLVLTAMAWQTARIRSTQSATGILYVVVIFCFLGEVISQVLDSVTGFIL